MMTNWLFKLKVAFKIVSKLPTLVKEIRELIDVVKTADENTKVGTIRKEYDDVIKAIDGVLR